MTIEEAPTAWKSVVSWRPVFYGSNCGAIDYQARMVALPMPALAQAQDCCRYWSLALWRALSIGLAGLCLVTFTAQAQDATWALNPGSSDWNTLGNWVPTTVPTGTASFGASNTTAITFSNSATIGSLQFNSGAPAYTFTLSGVQLTISGGGVVNNASNQPIFSDMAASTLSFLSSSTASNASITNNDGGSTIFHDTSTAGTARITNNSLQGSTTFLDSSSAGNATITNNSLGVTEFAGTSTGQNATIITNGNGFTFFFESSTGGQARLITNAGGIVDLSALTSIGMTAGSIEGAGLYQLGSAALTVGSNNLNTAVSGDVVDGGTFGGTGGSLIKIGTGTLTLTGANTYSGGTSFNGGTLAVNSDANLGTGPLSFNGGALEALAAGGGITSAKTVTLNAGGGTFLADAATISMLGGPISGPGSLTKAGPGTLTLTGANTYIGGTNLNGGILAVNTDANLGTGPLSFNGGTLEALAAGGGISSAKAVTLNAGGGTFLADDGTTSTLSGPISGVGSLTKDGLGTLILAIFPGANTYGGATNVVLGTLQAGSSTAFSPNSAFIVTSTLDLKGFSNTIGSLSGNGTVTNNGSALATLTVGTDGTDTTFTGRVNDGTSALELTKTGNGMLTLTGNNTYSGGTNFNGGILAVNSNSNLGIGALSFDGGTLEALAAGGGIGSTKVVTLNAGGGTFLADTGTTSTLGGSIGGVGSLTKIGAGILVLTGVNTYGGGTNFNGGILAVDSDSNLGAGPLSFNGGTLEALAAGAGITSIKAVTLNAGGGTFLADTGTISTLGGGISGVGSLTKDGLGTLALTGANTYSGGTILSNGILVVGSPRALGVGNVLVKGGILTTDPQAINVAGNYTQSGGTLLLHVGGANAGQYDRLSVGGHASLGGTLQVVALSGFQLAQGDQLTLVSAGGGIQGTFSNFIDPFLSNTVLQPGLVYEPDSVILELLFTSFAPFALTANQLTVARNLDNIVFDSRAARLIDFLASEPVTNLPADFDRIAPAELSSVYEVSFSGANIQRLNLTSRMADIREGATGFSSQLSVNRQPLPMGKDGKGVVEEKSVLQPSPENRWGVFVSGDGDFVNVDGDRNAGGYDFTTGGVTVGIDYRVAKNLALGLMGGYAHTWTDLVRDGRVDVNNGKAGLYATWWNQGFYVNGFVGGGFNSYNTIRGALQGSASGNTDGREFETFFDAGYDAKIGNWSLGLYGTLASTYVGLSSFNENGSLAPLDIVSQHQNSLRSDLGIRTEYRIKSGGVELRPRLRLAWEHEYLYSALPIDARFASGAGGTFTVFGPSEGHDSLIVSAGLSVQLTQKLLLYVDYDGQVGRERYASQGVVGGLQWSF